MKGPTEAITLEVAVKTSDGDTIHGWIVAGITGKLEQTLNKDVPFIEFIDAGGKCTFLSKSQIASVEAKQPLKKPVLNARTGNGVTCFEVLGLPEDCTFDEAKNAYHRLVKAYHPDLYSNPDFPAEIIRYATDAFSQVSSAFAEIKERFNAAA